jgi:hypothetical protein
VSLLLHTTAVVTRAYDCCLDAIAAAAAAGAPRALAAAPHSPELLEYMHWCAALAPTPRHCLSRPWPLMAMGAQYLRKAPTFCSV